jgi:hypothetical protein
VAARPSRCRSLLVTEASRGDRDDPTVHAMTTPNDLALDSIHEIAATVQSRLELGYRIEALDPEPLFFGFNIWDPEGVVATLRVTRTNDVTSASLLIDLTREVYKTLKLCPLCSRLAAIQRFDRIIEIKCPGCGPYRIDITFARELVRARATLDETLLAGAMRVSRALRQRPLIGALTRESFVALLTDDS